MSANPKPSVAGLSLSRDGNTLVVAGGDAKIRLIDVASGEVRRILTGHTNAIYRAVFSPDEKLLGSSSRDLTVRVWDVATGQQLHSFGGFRCSVKAVAFSPDGKLVAGAGNDGMVKIWDLKSGAELKSLVHKDSAEIDMSVYSIGFSGDGQKIYAANGDGTISEWDVKSGAETKVWKAHGSDVHKLLFSTDYHLLASQADAAVKLWDTSNWHEMQSLPMTDQNGVSPRASEIAFSHDGKLIAVTDTGIDPKQNTYAFVRAIVWNAQTGEKLFTIGDHKFDIDGLVFSRDDRYLLTGSVDQTIKFWDMKTGQLARTISLAGK